MKIIIDEKEYVIDPNIVQVASNTTDVLLNTLTKSAQKGDTEILYIVTLLLLKEKANFLLENIGEENIEFFLLEYENLFGKQEDTTN